MIWQQILHTSPDLANTLIQANETEIQAYETFKVARRRVVDAFGALCVRSLEFSFLRPLLLSLDMLDDFYQNTVHMEGHDQVMSKFDALFVPSSEQWPYDKMLWSTVAWIISVYSKIRLQTSLGLWAQWTCVTSSFPRC